MWRIHTNTRKWGRGKEVLSAGCKVVQPKRVRLGLCVWRVKEWERIFDAGMLGCQGDVRGMITVITGRCMRARISWDAAASVSARSNCSLSQLERYTQKGRTTNSLHARLSLPNYLPFLPLLASKMKTSYDSLDSRLPICRTGWESRVLLQLLQLKCFVIRLGFNMGWRVVSPSFPMTDEGKAGPISLESIWCT